MSRASSNSLSCRGAAPESCVSIFAVVVIYKIAAADSIGLQSLLFSHARSSDSALELQILVVDNTPDADVATETLPRGARRIACPENSGLANAYNRAIEAAVESRTTWLLTLDQDTKLPETFLDDMVRHARMRQHDASAAAILPRVLSDDTCISPFRFGCGIVPVWYGAGVVSIPSQPVFGINSGSLIRVDALSQAGGYDPWFWLDCSDLVVFHRLHKLGKRILVAADIEIRHELSVKNMQTRLSVWRYRHMLLAESAFWDAEMGALAGIERTCRLGLRFFRQVMKSGSSELRSLTGKALVWRIFRSRDNRAKLFRSVVEEHLGDRRTATALAPRNPMVSVCMASYNAGHYIELQLQSILPQLGAGDEIVIVDDNSSDDTTDRIRAFADPRIRLITNNKNKGVTQSFEHALRSATGDLLFLSDHDDLWKPDKVELFREAFARGEHVQLVMSAVSLIDSDGVPFRSERWDRNGQFRRGFLRNVIKNGYQGSSLAIRSSLLKPLLPFPVGRAYLHDAWIGTLNDRLGGGMIFLPEPLLLYRRHSKNVSQPMTPWRRILSRTQLLLDHLMHIIRGVRLLERSAR